MTLLKKMQTITQRKDWKSLKSKRRSRYDFSSFFGDPAGARTQDPILKRDVLYQLSY